MVKPNSSEHSGQRPKGSQSEVRSIYDKDGSAPAKNGRTAQRSARSGRFTPGGSYTIEEFPSLKRLFEKHNLK